MKSGIRQANDTVEFRPNFVSSLILWRSKRGERVCSCEEQLAFRNEE